VVVTSNFGICQVEFSLNRGCTRPRRFFYQHACFCVLCCVLLERCVCLCLRFTHGS
jgi:hypothetical protein